MNVLTATIAMAVSFSLFIYLYGLQAEHSVRYHGFFYTFPIILLLIALFSYAMAFSEYKETKK